MCFFLRFPQSLLACRERQRKRVGGRGREKEKKERECEEKKIVALFWGEIFGIPHLHELHLRKRHLMFASSLYFVTPLFCI